MKKSFVIVAVVAALTVAVFAANSGSKAITVGDFAVKVSRALGKATPDQEAAASNLKSAGVNLGKDLGARLTEREAARILNDLGIRATTRTPENSVSGAKADQFVVVIGSEGVLATAAVVPADVVPTVCLQESNRGNCQNCCKLANGCAVNGACDFASACATFCKQVLPPGKASPTEPPP